MSIELRQLTLQQKWSTAESNLVYFIACGISYAKSRGQTAEDFGTWAGQVATPSWEEERSQNLGPKGLVEGISHNKQQFQGFEIEVLDEAEECIRARMRCFGENTIRQRPHYHVSVDEYIQCFDKKWAVIADFLGLEYKQHVEADWVVFTVSKK